ncbi:hypothetical protein PFICI_15116 [Pestalotiopsis fici W106-1]|uniref:Uncharacterized protein n=1 Tax=Pestalotiopsis fici (strain W106-1 / CGMCC3.15140) TaxID=1229662 RepID=W3WK29_PESFW|nr:uncharacterized protein PFICI_15116 [Pestalotiopsis fici W106-1]ETS73171.1 hypothetical protein PFICI_15116 [Pestalotiopsis fici W106-1]
MHLPYRTLETARSQNSKLNLRDAQENSGNPSNAIIIVASVFGAFVVCGAIAWAISKNRRQKKRKGKKGHRYVQANNNDDGLEAPSRRNAGGTSNNSANRNENMTSNVQRNVSIRSIMTLPAYSPGASANEQVLGREGDRDGVDIVVEHPTEEEHEALRDEEMETMYQIRESRRQRIAAQAETRQLRDEARRRGDHVALRELREISRARAASSSNASNELREHQAQIKEQRARAVSSVSYEGLGVARHDGSRLRANSQESDRVQLLSDAASISLSTRSPSALSHRRDRSASSVLSFDSSRDLSSPGLPRSGATTPRRLSTQHNGDTAGSSPEIITEADLGEIGLPLHDPPTYDDVSLDDTRSGATTPVHFNEPPPDYSSGPSKERDRRLSAQVADMFDNVAPDGDLGGRSRSDRRSQDSSSGSPSRPVPFPRLPSLSFDEIPQIIVEPSSAYPRDESRERGFR